MAVDADAHARKVATNESTFRDANDRLRRVAVGHRFGPTDPVPFLCECSDSGCFESVMLTLQEYEGLRAHPTWFLLVAGHEEAEATHERIIEAESGYAIVEKTGAAGREAARLQARAHDAA